jgi:hypothetical protein
VRRRAQLLELVGAEPQRRPHRRVDRAQQEPVDGVVESAPQPGDAVDQLGGEGPVAGVEPGAGQLAPQHEVGVGALGVDADQRS